MTNTALTAVIGYTAAAVGSLLMMPQVVKSWRTRRVDELSLGMILLYVCSCALWVAYGLLTRSGPLQLANGVGLLLGAAQLVFKLSF